MSAPSSSPAPPTSTAPAGWPTSLRLLGAVAFAAVGFVAVWQGFGAAGYGTDTHTKRVCWACLQLFGFGLVLVTMKGRLPVRLLIALVALGSTCAVWWTVRSGDFKSAMSLSEAVEKRDLYRALLATATADDIERYEGLRGINFVLDQYPSLAGRMAEDYDRWKDGVTDDLVARYGRVAPDDLKTVAALRERAKLLTEVYPKCTERLDTARNEWVARAVKAKTEELREIRAFDENAFDRTAPGRKALAEAVPDSRAALVAAEEEWATGAAEWLTLRSPVWQSWRDAEERLLARQSLDTSDGRFKEARGWLFVLAHQSAQHTIAAHLDSGRYDLAFGVARKHAVEWNATATVLGASEVKKLDALRDHCEAFAKLFEVSAKPTEPLEVAPPPRAKPE